MNKYIFKFQIPETYFGEEDGESNWASGLVSRQVELLAQNDTDAIKKSEKYKQEWDKDNNHWTRHYTNNGEESLRLVSLILDDRIVKRW